MKIAGRQGLLNGAVIVTVLLAIFVITLLPIGAAPPSPFSVFALGRRNLADAVLNFVLFCPLGIAIGWNGRSTLFAGLLGLLAATVIEMLQMYIPGRDPALSDILVNAAGAVAGAAVGRRRQAWIHPDAKTAATLAVAGISAAALVMTATAYLFFPMPGTPSRGSVQVRLPSSPGNGSPDVRPLLSKQLPFAPEPLLIGQSGDDLLLRFPSRGSAFGFDQPEYWDPRAFEGTSGKRVRLSVTREGARWHIAMDSHWATIGPTVGQGWAALVYPDAIGRRWGALVSALWLFGMFVPAGFWARGSWRVTSLVIIVVLLAVLPAVTGIVSTRPEEWAGALIGFAAGMALSELKQRWLSRRRA